MNKIINFLSVVFLVIIIGSCEKDANVELPTVDSKLVVSSFISPQDNIIKVDVTLSQPLYNTTISQEYLDVKNATVKISNGIITKTLPYNSSGYCYSLSASQFPIVVGKTYYLTVSTPDGKNVNASTIIPSENSTLSYSSRILKYSDIDTTYFVEMKWNDTPGAENYYRACYYYKGYDAFLSITTYSLYFSDNFSDKNNDGKIFNENFEMIKNQYFTSNVGELSLIHASKEYYLYHSKIEDAVSSSNNPFAEPEQMYSNINGGYGVFAGFNRYSLQVSL